MHLGSLESTQEARVARGDSRVQLLRIFRACSPDFPRASITRYTHAKHEQILNFPTTILAGNLTQMPCVDETVALSRNI